MRDWCATTSSPNPRIKIEDTWVQERKHTRNKKEEGSDTKRNSVLPRVKKQERNRSRERNKRRNHQMERETRARSNQQGGP
jgi:hypothetical protein